MKRQDIEDIRQKYIDAELEHYRKTGEKSIKLRSKVSALTEVLKLEPLQGNKQSAESILRDVWGENHYPNSKISDHEWSSIKAFSNISTIIKAMEQFAEQHTPQPTTPTEVSDEDKFQKAINIIQRMKCINDIKGLIGKSEVIEILNQLNKR